MRFRENYFHFPHINSKEYGMNKSSSFPAGVLGVVFLLLFVAGLMVNGMGQAQALAADGKGAFSVSYTARFSQSDFSFERMNDYDQVSLKDGDWLSELGKPMLPSKEIKIALPAGMAVQSVQVVNFTEEQFPGEYNIYPAQPPLTTNESSSSADFIPPDQQTYSSSQPYPAEMCRFVNQTDLAGQSMAVVEIFPLRYVPLQKKLTYCSSLTIEIDGTDGYVCGDYLSPNVSENDRRNYEQMVKGMVKNPESVQLVSSLKMSTTVLPSGGPFAHVIITSSGYASAFQPLVDWHNQKGVKDTVITTAWIYANYTGADTQKVRAFIMDAAANWGTSYFLIGGENETVPFAYRLYYSESTPSDQYYSDYDNDWTNEVFVGRASAGSTIEVTTFVNKVLKYEKDPPRTDYPLDVLLVGMDVDASTHEEVMKDSIDRIIPDRFNVTKVYDSQTSNHRTATINALNAGQNLVNHADHSNIDVLGTGDYHHGWGVYSSDIDALTNDNQLCILVSLGCLPNRMDANDCIAEHFVLYNPNQAGVAFTGNTRNGLFYSGQPYSLSAGLDKEWWVSLFSRNMSHLGQTLADAKHHFANTDNYMKHCEWEFNLLGEPEMPIWTDSLDSFTVTCSVTVPMGSSSFPVHVENATAKSPVNQAYVCLWKDNDVYQTAYTNANGDATLTPSPSSSGTMYVTVTVPNYVPSQKMVDVSYACGDANQDAVIDAGDLVYLINYLYKDGPAPNPMEVGDVNLDSVVDIGDVVFLLNYLYKSGAIPCSG
jgi:hypothetical protein